MFGTQHEAYLRWLVKSLCLDDRHTIPFVLSSIKIKDQLAVAIWYDQYIDWWMIKSIANIIVTKKARLLNFIPEDAIWWESKVVKQCWNEIKELDDS